MKPIKFTCRAMLPIDAVELGERILDTRNWSDFNGYGPLPGIREATFVHRTPEVVGSRIRVTNTDGSTHVEEIVAWRPGRELALRLGEFSPPLSRFAEHIDEEWELEPDGEKTQVARRMRIFAKSVWSRPPLWLISCLLKWAIARHLRDIAVPNEHRRGE